MEHRWGRRRSSDVTVQFMARPAMIGTGRVINISVTGAFMATTVPLRILSLLYVAPKGAWLDNRDTECLVAYVVRRDATGVGLEWCESAEDPRSVNDRLAALRGEAVDALNLPSPSSDRMPISLTQGDARVPIALTNAARAVHTGVSVLSAWDKEAHPAAIFNEFAAAATSVNSSVSAPLCNRSAREVKSS